MDQLRLVEILPPIEYYRVQGRWMWNSGMGGRFRPRRWWLRTWQAEWDGCRRAPRAYTKAGIRRKAPKARAREMNDW